MNNVRVVCSAGLVSSALVLQMTPSEKRLTDEDQARGKDSNQPRVARLAHDAVDDGGNRAAEQGRKHAQTDVRHIVLDVAIANVVKLEPAVVADDPTGEREQELGSV